MLSLWISMVNQWYRYMNSIAMEAMVVVSMVNGKEWLVANDSIIRK